LVRRDSSGARDNLDRQLADHYRVLLLVLATLWLFDAVLQIQPSMFTPGPGGLSAILHSAASPNSGWIARTITWNASTFLHHPVLTNTVCCVVQFLIAFGIVVERSRKAALALSVVWSLGVWWFGEGLGRIMSGGATPLGGGPGGALFYAVLAIVLWPCDRTQQRFVAARSVGPRAAKIIWAVVWMAMAMLAVVGSGRSPRALSAMVVQMNARQPGWLARLDRFASTMLLGHGGLVAAVLGLVCVVVAVGVFLQPPVVRATLVLALAVFGVMWVATQNFGGVLAGGATDPSSGPVVMVLALAYWPFSSTRDTSSALDSLETVNAAGLS
jgi:hypothetical protein